MSLNGRKNKLADDTAEKKKDSNRPCREAVRNLEEMDLKGPQTEKVKIVHAEKLNK